MAARTNGKIGFALGGLGGINAHGVGFLEAARALGIEPDFVTCSSGMIRWVADWLEEKPLLPRLEEQLSLGSRFPPPFHWVNTLWIATFGDPATFRPAVWEYWRRWMQPVDWADAKTLLDRLWPAQVYVPRRDPEDLARIASVMNASAIPVAFNSFHPASGREYLHVNPAAQEALKVKVGAIGDPVKYAPITESAVRGALWLYFYGFDDNMNPDGLVDGSYHRQFIASELHGCDRIYLARPRNSRWDGRLPQNYFEVQDFTTDHGFDAAYTAELAGLRQINRLIADGQLYGGDFHSVELIEVEVRRHYGFFEPLEERSVFDEAFRTAYHVLTSKESMG